MHNISLNAVPYSTNTTSTTLLDDAYMKLNHDWSLLKQYTEFRLDRKIQITFSQEWPEDIEMREAETLNPRLPPPKKNRY